MGDWVFCRYNLYDQLEVGRSSHAPSPASRMTEHGQSVGFCPFCGSVLPVGSILIEHESDGEQRVFARCSECREPVHPEWVHRWTSRLWSLSNSERCPTSSGSKRVGE